MVIIELDETVQVRRERMVVISHGQTQLERGLEHRETVVLRTADGDFYAARVEGIEFEPEDTVYTFDVSSRLTEDLALERVAGLDPAVHDLALHEIVDLLGELSREPRAC